MDRVRPETLAEIKKKERAYPHEIRAMVAELEAVRLGRPFEEPKTQSAVKPGVRIIDEMYVVAVPTRSVAKRRPAGEMSNMYNGEYGWFETRSGIIFLVWRAS